MENRKVAGDNLPVGDAKTKTLTYKNLINRRKSKMLAKVLGISLLLLVFAFGMAFAQEKPDLTDNDGNGIPDIYDKILRDISNKTGQQDAAVATKGVITTGAVVIQAALGVNVMPDQERWSGESFPVWGNVKGGTSPYTYEWDIDSDGAVDYSGAVTDPRYIAVTHAFSLPVGTTRQIYTATLKVTDNNGLGVSDTDFVEVDVIDRGNDPVADEPAEIRDLEVNMAIQDGLRWLYLRQQGNGSWGPGRDVVGVTAEVVLAYEVQKHFPTNDWNRDIYAESVQAGLDFLFANAQIVPIGVQPYGNPDTDGDGNGVCFGFKGWNYPGEMYDTGLALQAIAGSLAPNRIVNVAVSPVNGWTYKNVVQDTADYCNWAQNEAGNGRGGWVYWANSDYSDNSNTQWPTLGLEAAEGIGVFSIPTPLFVKNELNIWVGYIQNAANGGSGYTAPNDGWNNVGKTGALLIEFYFLGDDTTSARVQSALTFITNNWTTDWEHFNEGSYYAMYSAMKGLRLLGITTLLDSTDWYDDYAEKLVDGVDGVGEQQSNGQWLSGGWDYTTIGELNTAWAILILSPIVLPGLETTVAVDIKPQSCPNPLNPKSKGVIPVAILGAEDFDVTQVEPASVLLEGVAPLRWNLEDVATPFEGEKTGAYDCTTEGRDGFMDLTLKFATQAVVAALGEVNDGDVLVLTLTGNLKEEFGGTAIRGEDVIIIRKKGKAAPASETFSFSATSAYPNPSNPEAWIPYTLGKDVEVSIIIYNASGQLIRTLNLGHQNAGAYISRDKAAYWDGRNESGEKVSSGAYFYTIKAGNFTATRKLVVLR
jgi:hypothetical protein